MKSQNRAGMASRPQILFVRTATADRSMHSSCTASVGLSCRARSGRRKIGMDGLVPIGGSIDRVKLEPQRLCLLCKSRDARP